MKDILSKIFRGRGEDRFLGIVGNGETSASIPFGEVVASAAVPSFRVIKSLSDARKFPYQYQDGSSSCVAHGTSKIATILYFLKTSRIVKFSPKFYYEQRSNRPGEGMVYEDIRLLASKGALLHDLLPCHGFSEAQMNEVSIEQYHRDSAAVFAIPENWVELPLDFDTVASTIEQTKKGIKLWFSFGPGEFFGTRYPSVRNAGNPPWRHDVTAVDAFTLDGKQYILIEDSADSEALYQKLIDRSFFSRCFLARYPIGFKFDGSDRPKYDGSLVSIQKILIFEKFFPSNVPTAERWGPTSRSSMEKFQRARGFAVTGDVTPQVISYMKKNYVV